MFVYELSGSGFKSSCSQLTKNTLQTRINEIFSTNIGENEYLIKNFKEEYDL